MDNLERLAFLDPDFEDDGQPSEYEEWQVMTGIKANTTWEMSSDE